MTETELLHLLLLRAPVELIDARLFRRNVGLYRSIEGNRVVKVGVEGQCDAYALLRGGRTVEIETKAARGRMLDEQRCWRDFCHTWGIPHVTLKAQRGESPDATVARWIEELRTVFFAITREDQ